MKNGYDQFFKEAQKAKGLIGDKPSKSGKTPKHAVQKTPEDRLRNAVAARVKEKKRIRARDRQSFPIFSAIVATAVLGAGTVALLRPELAEKWMGRIEIGAFGKAEAAAGAGPGPEKSAAPAKAQTAKTAETATSAKPAVAQEEKMGKGWSDEEMSFFKKLNDRKKEQDLREAELNKMEEELQRQKVELDEKIKRLEAMRGEISQTLKARVASDQEKVDKLVQMYSSMKPQQASKIIESLNEDLAVEVLDKMKKKSAAEIMNAMDSKKAQRLSELLTGYQRMPSSAKTSGEQID
jgi:flagellar motility protein MotE (MotC chaperone)